MDSDKMTKNPYQAPSADLAREFDGEYRRSRLLSFQGRLGRANFISFSALSGLVIYGLSYLLFVSAIRAVGFVALIFLIIGFVCFFLIFIQLQIRRLRDLNVTGWLVLIPIGFSLLINFVVPYANVDVGLNSTIWNLLLWVVQVSYLAYLCYFPGSPSANAYGSPSHAPAMWSIIVAAIFGAALLIHIGYATFIQINPFTSAWSFSA